MASSVQQVPAPGASVPATADNATGLVTAIPSLAPSYEWVYPNSEDGKYFTSTQAQVYIGNLFIDELVNLQFAFQGNRIPIYGYSSEEADAFARGKCLVQGQLALNFVTEGYLYTVLNEYKNFLQQPTPVQQDRTTQAASQIASLLTQSQQITQAMQGNLSATAKSSYQAQLDLIGTQIQSLAAQGGPDAIAAAKAATIQAPTKNAIRLKIPFDIHCTLTGGGRTVERIIHNAMLISNEQIYDQSGQTLLDCYGFVARNVN
jgi:hypothetical protein